MPYTNVTIPEMFCSHEENRKKILDLEHEVSYWKKRTDRAEDILRNIPEAVEKFGYVELSYDRNKRMTLVNKGGPDADTK